jgi:hypothetical protein
MFPPRLPNLEFLPTGELGVVKALLLLIISNVGFIVTFLEANSVLLPFAYLLSADIFNYI